MMRRYHRWLALLFGILLVWIAVTGLMSHAAALVRDAQGPAGTMAPGATASLIPTAQAHEGTLHNAAEPAAATAAPTGAAPVGFTCPATMTCRPKPHPDSAAAWTSYLHHLHAGEEFGLAGTILSIASGFALLFFAISGLWMYYELYRGRLQRTQRSGDKRRFFWR